MPKSRKEISQTQRAGYLALGQSAMNMVVTKNPEARALLRAYVKKLNKKYPCVNLGEGHAQETKV